MQKLSKALSTAFAVLAIFLAGACGGGGASVIQPPAGDSATPVAAESSVAAGNYIFDVVMQPQQPEPLPLKGASWTAPNELLSQLPPLPVEKDPSCTGSGFLMAGGDYSDDLLYVNVSREGDEDQYGRYSPAWTGGNTDDAAHAIYRWNLRGFSGSQTMGFTWGEGEEPSTWRNFWVGFGDLANDSWDWYKGPQDNVLTIDSFGPYRAAGGELLLIVLLLGTNEALLEKMEAGVPEQRATGEVEDLPGDVPEYPLLGFSGALPAMVDVSAGCAPINDQLTWGACTAFAVGDGAFNFELNRVYGSLGWDLTRDYFRVSPKYLYIISGEKYGYPPGGDTGRWTAEVIQTLRFDGIATEQNAPYELVYAKNWSPAADADAAVLSCDDWEEIPCNTWEGIETVKAVLALQQKPLPMRIYLDSSFFSYTSTGTWYPLGPSVGGHAMCIVGYDDARGDSGAFKVRNSWSEFWGDEGHVWIDYRAFLLPGTSVRAWTLDEDYSAGVVQRFNLASPGTPPPVAVEASDGTSTAYIEVSWLPHTSAAQLHIYRDTTDMPAATINGAATSWQDTGITDNYGHIYWVQADSSMLSPPDVGFLAALPEILSVEPASAMEGTSVAFVAGGTGSGPLYYDWNFGGGATPNTSADPRPQVTLASPGIYSASLTIENALGEDTFNFELTVTGTPPLVNYIENRSGFSGDVVTLTANLNGTATGWSWEFSGGATPATSSSASPAITLGAPGIYEASLEVSSPWGGDIYYFELAVLDPSETAWTLPGHDGRSSGQSPVTGPQTNNLKWKFYAGFGDSLSDGRAREVLVLPDNTLIVSSYTVEGSALRRLNPDGSLVWAKQYFEEYNSYGQPMIGEYSGNLYVARGTVIQALDPADGSLLWEYDPTEEGYSISPRTESSNGLLYIALAGKYLVAIDVTDGTEAFAPIQLADKYSVIGPSLVAPNGTMFIASEFAYDDLLIAFDTEEAAPAGSMRTQAPAESMALSADGRTLLVTDGGGSTRAIDTATCRQLWLQNGTSGGSSGSTDVRVMADGTAIVTNERSQVFALEPETGEIIWDYDLGLEDDCYGASAIGRDGTIYVGGSNKKLYAVRNDALLWESADAGAWYFNGDPALAPDGTLYCGADDGWLYAFGPGGGEGLIPAHVSGVIPTEGDTGTEVSFSADMQGTAPVTYSWNFDGGATPNSSTDASPTVTLGDVGDYSCTLSVSNAYGSHDFAFNLTVKAADLEWQTYSIRDDGDYGNYINAGIVNGKLAILYNDHVQDAQYYGWATVDVPTQPSDWQHVQVESGDGGYRALTMLEFAAKPVVAYKKQWNDLRIALADSSTPSNPTNWNPHWVMTAGISGTYGKLFINQGKLAVVHNVNEGGEERVSVHYASVETPDEEADWSEAKVFSGTRAGALEYLEIDSKPAIAVQYIQATNLQVFLADIEHPLSESDWSSHVVDPVVESGAYCGAALIGGLPAICNIQYVDTNTPLSYAWSGAAIPDETADWTNVLVGEEGYPGTFTALGTIYGLPAIAFGQPGTRSLRLALAKTATPSSSADWDLTQIDASNMSSESPTIINHAGNVFVIYYDYDDKRMRCAVLQ